MDNLNSNVKHGMNRRQYNIELTGIASFFAHNKTKLPHSTNSAIGSFVRHTASGSTDSCAPAAKTNLLLVYSVYPVVGFEAKGSFLDQPPMKPDCVCAKLFLRCNDQQIL